MSTVVECHLLASHCLTSRQIIHMVDQTMSSLETAGRSPVQQTQHLGSVAHCTRWRQPVHVHYVCQQGLMLLLCLQQLWLPCTAAIGEGLGQVVHARPCNMRCSQLGLSPPQASTTGRSVTITTHSQSLRNKQLGVSVMRTSPMCMAMKDHPYCTSPLYHERQCADLNIK